MAAISGGPPISMTRDSAARVAVIGAGAFGGWTALELLRRGARVQLIDAWGPGNVRASSGGETRVIRATYGTHVVYTAMAAHALDLWRAHERRWQRGLLHETGALWMFGADDSFGRSSARALADHGLPVDEITATEARKRYPQINLDDVSLILLEHKAGYLFARRACEHVVERYLLEGGDYRRGAAVSPARIDRGTVVLTDDTIIEADAFVFACGPWMGALFPDVIGSLITPTRQDVYYFGAEPGDTSFTDPLSPVWLDATDRFIYGIAGASNRGFKVADDTPGRAMDPTTDDRIPTTAGIATVRAFLRKRFPPLEHAPLVASEVCQYESTPDANFIIDTHPEHAHVWLVGGGSGHGFKMGPAIGEMVASLVLDDSPPEPIFRLARLATPPPGGWQAKWS
jgi:glycine/D-amino acid oxidase-like deaminating enzyme